MWQSPLGGHVRLERMTRKGIFDKVCSRWTARRPWVYLRKERSGEAAGLATLAVIEEERCRECRGDGQSLLKAFEDMAGATSWKSRYAARSDERRRIRAPARSVKMSWNALET